MSRLPAWASAYLHRLGLEPRPAGYAYLSELCRAHLQAFPFENVGKLLQARRPGHSGLPSPEQFVADAARCGFGGTCYSIHANLLALLRALDFSAHLVPVGDAHTAVIVRLPEWGGEPVYVDLGSAAPLYQPVRFRRDPDNCTRFGTEAVRIAPDAERPGRYRYLRYRREKLVSDHWHFDPEERREPDDFADAIARSFLPGATFLNCLRIHVYQWDNERSVSLKNNTLLITHADGSERRVTLGSVRELEEAVADEFRLPRLPVREAVEALRARGIDPFAPET
jgi:N-hydroxyarylamine O-acetyltransferase